MSGSRLAGAALAVDARRRRHPAAAAVLVLVGLLLIWFWPLLTGDQLGQNHVLFDWFPWSGDRPAGFDVAPRSGEVDAVLVFEPLLSLAREQLHAGHLPLWNPFSYGGMTLAGDMQTALLYPITWVGLVLPVHTAWGIMAVLKLLTGGVGAYTLARHLKIGWGPAVIAGAVFMLSAPLVVWLQWPLTTVFSLFPWLILVTDRLAHEPSRRRVGAVALVVALSLLAGHPETALLSSSAAGVYLVVLLLVRYRRAAVGAWRTVAAWVGGHLVGALVAGAMLVPFFDAWTDSITREAHDALSLSHVPWWSAIVYALPDLYGDGAPLYVGPPFSYLIVAATFGVTAALLALIGAWRVRRRPETAALGAMALAALGVAFAIPPVSWVMQNVPPFATGNNARVFYVVALVGAVGAAAGIEALVRRPLPWRQVVAWIGGAVAFVALGIAILHLRDEDVSRGLQVDALKRFAVVAVGATACLLALGRLRRPLALTLVLVVAVGELAYLQDFNVMLPPSQAYPGTPASIKAVQAQPGTFRVSRFRAGDPREVFPPDTNANYGLESPAGYDFPQSKRWSDFSWFVLAEQGITREVTYLTPPPPTGAQLAGLRLVNTRYYVAGPTAPSPGHGFTVVHRDAGAVVYRDPGALPRAWVTGRVQTATDTQALTTLQRNALDARHVALVPPGAAVPDRANAAPRSFRPARYERLSPEHVRITLPPGAAGWLVVGDAYHRGWKATVDGRDATVSPTDFAVMGLPVRAGDRVVDFTLDRRPYWVGGAITAGGLALLLWLAWPLRRRPRAAT
jgi:hypothetical protein